MKGEVNDRVVDYPELTTDDRRLTTEVTRDGQHMNVHLPICPQCESYYIMAIGRDAHVAQSDRAPAS